MAYLLSAASRRVIATPSIVSSVRALASSAVGGGGASVDVDHYTSGWNMGDLAEFSSEGKYQIQTFNKISEKVRP